MRAGEQFVTVRAPAPAAELPRIRAALAELAAPPAETPETIQERAA